MQVVKESVIIFWKKEPCDRRKSSKKMMNGPMVFASLYVKKNINVNIKTQNKVTLHDEIFLIKCWLSHRLTGSKYTSWFKKMNVVAAHIILSHFNDCTVKILLIMVVC